MSDIYQDNPEQLAEREYTISILTENKPGMLNNITIIFTRRKININAINVSASEIPGVHRYTIVLITTLERVDKVVKQIRKHIDVLGAFVYEEGESHYQEIALYKVPTSIFLGGNHIEQLVRSNGARILVIEEEYIVLEKTGHKQETQQLLEILQPYGVLEFVRSGRVSISKSKRKTETFLEELENSTTHILHKKHNNGKV